MKAYVGITDYDWFSFLSRQPSLDEVNFWKPGGKTGFRALESGGLFLFKLHAPRNFIVGGGHFAHFSFIPASLAWEAFGTNNGARTFEEMRDRIGAYREERIGLLDDPTIGCVLLEQPFFFSEEEWIPEPADWKSATQQGKTYDLTSEIGRDLWDDVQLRLSARRSRELVADGSPSNPPGPGYGEPVLVRPRLGQGTFRVLVTDNYERRCAVTGERTLPVLQAAHIKPFSMVMEHDARNGLLLRSDIHTLFDRGYVTVTPEHRFEVSRRLKEDWENGHDYYALRGNQVRIPEKVDARPDAAFLQWHAENVFRG
jgi:putative restriction endonuclease